jgi:hypothetical protein
MEQDGWRNLDESEKDSPEEDILYEEESRGDEEYFEDGSTPLKAQCASYVILLLSVTTR